MIGAGLILILIFRPDGLSQEYRLSIRKPVRSDPNT
jgi:hypothetical protein